MKFRYITILLSFIFCFDCTVWCMEPFYDLTSLSPEEKISIFENYLKNTNLPNLGEDYFIVNMHPETKLFIHDTILKLQTKQEIQQLAEIYKSGFNTGIFYIIENFKLLPK